MADNVVGPERLYLARIGDSSYNDNLEKTIDEARDWAEGLCRKNPKLVINIYQCSLVESVSVSVTVEVQRHMPNMGGGNGD